MPLHDVAIVSKPRLSHEGYRKHESRIIVHNVDAMSGEEFERYLRLLFERMGYAVKQTRVTKDQGADLVIERMGERIVVQAKRTTRTVGVGAVQEVVGSLRPYGASRGWVVATSEFSTDAIELAKSNEVVLIGRARLQELMGESS